MIYIIETEYDGHYRSHFFLKERRSSFDFRLNHSLGDFLVPR